MAEEFFVKHSYQLVARSLKTPYGEIDRLFRSYRSCGGETSGGCYRRGALHSGSWSLSTFSRERSPVSPAELEYVLLEVKSMGRWEEVPAVHSRQRQRLYKNLEYLSAQLNAPVELMYAVVSRHQLTLYEESFESL